jgi:uncharacterized protein
LKKTNKKEFENIVNDILINDKFKELDNELHHGISRASHSIRVAKGTYTVTKKLNLNYKNATRAALMHDFYVNEDLNTKNSFKALSEHPSKALKNAEKYYNITSLESNIIESHMFPFGNKIPKYAESWIVTLVDKTVAVYEMYRYKLSLTLGVYIIFLFNMITIQR